MSMVYITLRIMPESTDLDFDALREEAEDAIEEFDGNIGEVEEEPVAFGLKALNITFSMPEEKGDTEPLEQEIAEFDGVQSVDVTDVRRAIG